MVWGIAINQITVPGAVHRLGEIEVMEFRTRRPRVPGIDARRKAGTDVAPDRQSL